MDRESELLLLEMQLEDLNQLVAGNDAMNCNGDRSDYDVSLELLRQDLIDRITAHKDRALCSSIACALNRDHPALEHQREMENSALQDREMALSLDQDPTTARTAGQDPHNQQEHLLDDETLVKLAMRYNSEEAGMSILGFDNDDASDTSPAAATRRALKQAAITRQCTACQDNFKICDIARAPCSHEYCGECLGAIFTGAIGDEAYYPPRCCRQTIPLEKVRMFLPADIAQDFQAKVPELETKDRTYCHVPNCSAWISPDHIVNGTGTCDCPADEGTQQLLEVARGQRWQRCYQCRRVIELNTGCYHITCRCGAHFCYVCGEPWKTCECPHWSEANLLARAEQVFDRGNNQADGPNAAAGHIAAPANIPAAAVTPEPRPDPFARVYQEVRREREVRRIAEELRANHDCYHEKWRFINGSHDCEECGHTLPRYIFECRGCRMRACWRCRRHRL
ncbi:ubiquitin-protein transferase-like protein 3 [Elsinoe australis]|uniref:Ubiquitin-protein transferase-like protein 3 n=1 Tax=Elsinoe australis TaxID=40998 RepID=A0A4V6DU98_9PEZI|nr:ubiquitin-protein transferase-like protein 3 [Elsinoe australis]